VSEYLPFTEQHSIQEVQIAVHFQHEFGQEEIASARAGVEPEVKDALPRSAEMRGGSVTVDMSSQGAQVRTGSVESNLAGFQYSRIRGDGKPSLVLQLANNLVSFNVLEYGGWEIVRADSIKYIAALLSFLSLESNPVMATSLKFTDRYTFDGETSDAKADLLFVAENEYMTARCFTAGPLWHCHSGWFDDLVTAGRVLNHLNVGSGLVDLAPTVTIDHQATVHLSTPRQSLDAFLRPSEESGGLPVILDTLHNKNKEILGAILLPEMLGKIGMEA
jgi:uncharacterized protein (TIGR04255 family)